MLQRSIEDWEAYLSSAMELPVQASYGRSRSTPVQVRWQEGRPSIRMHEMFASAPEEIAESMVSWLKNGRRSRKACRALDSWIHEQLEALPARPPRKIRAELIGQVHDLGVLAREITQGVLSEEFAGGIALPVLTWGRRVRSRSRHTLQLGSYSPENHLVRIHPVLDQQAVPAWFVRYVIFHELLHAVLPAERDGKKRFQHHGPEFKRREQAYADYPRALEWEKRNLAALIRSARNGTPLRPQRAPQVADLVEALQGLLFH